MDLPENSQISTDSRTKGFDISAGQTWIYPENYPVREYQYNIVQTALYNNTLVCLPTGLGKTFIAAVIMYNYWRWYPRGKVVFLAPTKPLVAQQIHACHDIMGIPSLETVELTGAINQKQREIQWFKKRVVFATPQVFQNDLEKNIVPSELVKCVVIDEAHKALGKHSYSECIRILSERNQFFRILALSATPGNKMDNVQEVLQKLHISSMELRDETSQDIVPYINQRKIDVIVVPLGNELTDFKERYVIIMDRHVKFLIKCNVIQAQTANITKGRVFHLLTEFKKKVNKSGNHGQIMKTLNILLTMYHAYELMIRHGLRAFHKFYQNHSDKFWMNSENQLDDLLNDIGSYLGPFPNILPSNTEDIPEVPQNLVFGHKKFHKLKELLIKHFENGNGKEDSTRAIVFIEYRDIVSEVYVLLLQARPLIRPQMFVGQAGQKQRQQIKALEDFRSNRVNVLISTSIGEEGLDVGEVDLIICFDISQQSPTRLVQRMGRTGRRRDGHIIVLVTDGKEHETLKSTMRRRDSLNRKILNTSNVFASLYQNNPRMVPQGFNPECHKMHIIPQPKTPAEKGKIQKKGNPKKKLKSTLLKTRNNKNAGNLIRNEGECQFSLMKFLVHANNTTQPTNTCIGTNNNARTYGGNSQNSISANDVKLLSLDNEGIDFLTLCALRQSEKDMHNKNIEKIGLTYIYRPPLCENFFNFCIPDMTVLNNISLLNDKAINNAIVEKENETYNTSINNEDFWCSDRYRIMSPKNDFEECIDLEKSKFEDLLDESSDSQYVPSPCKENVHMQSAKISCVSPLLVLNRETVQIGAFEDILSESSTSLDEVIQSPNLKYSSTTLAQSGNKKDNMLSTMHLFETSNNQSCSTGSPHTPVKISESFGRGLENINIGVLETQQIPKSKANTSVLLCKGTHGNISTIPRDNEKMLSITQALDKITHFSSVSSPSEVLQQTDNVRANIFTTLPDDFDEIHLESEDDMFKDSWEQTIETPNDLIYPHNKLSQTYEHTIQNKESEHCSKVRCTDIAKLINDDDWDSDFEIVSPPPNAPVNASKNKNNINLCNINLDQNAERSSSPILGQCRQIKANFSYLRDLKSFSQAESVEKQNIAKKLSAIHKPSTSKSKISILNSKDETDSESEFTIPLHTINNLNESKSTHFISNTHDVTTYETSASRKHARSIFSLNRHGKQNNSIKNCDNLPKADVHCFANDKQQSLCSSVINLHNKVGRNKTKLKRRNKYIDDEADVTCDNSSDESLSTDEDLSDFVSYTQDVQECVDMQAHYLQTVKSPGKKPGSFLLRKPKFTHKEIYSQVLSQENETYVYDSFCVNDDEELLDMSKHGHGYSILETVEEQLKNKKRKRGAFNDSERHSRKILKKLHTKNTSSSEDETELLRQQVLDESILLKESGK